MTKNKQNMTKTDELWLQIIKLRQPSGKWWHKTSKVWQKKVNYDIKKENYDNKHIYYKLLILLMGKY